MNAPPRPAADAIALADIGRRYAAQAPEDGIQLEQRDITGAEVLPGDALPIGVHRLIVVRREDVGGGIRLHLADGELLAVHPHTKLTVLRPVPPGPRPRSWWETVR